MTIADRIRERMAALNLTQLATARRAGLGPDYVRDILRGRVKEPGGRKLSQLATALDCSVEYLLGASDIEGKPPMLADPFEDVTVDLPIAHRLAAGVYRHVDAEDGELPGNGTISTTYPGMHADDGVWLALVEDDHAQPLVPRGYVLQVLENSQSVATRISKTKTPSDLVVLEHLAAGGSLVERIVAQVQFSFSGMVYVRVINGESKIPPLGKEGHPEWRLIGWVLEARRRFDDADCTIEGVWPRLR